MIKKLKPIPHFHSEAEEREFWNSHDTTTTWIGVRRNGRASQT
jgi:hypothetical protein